MKNHRKLATILATGTVLLTLAACGNTESTTTPEPSPSTAAAHNSADVDFASQMIPHHQQALRMVEITRGRTLSPEMKKLTEDIEAAQGPEIRLMQGWLKAWDEPAPESTDGGGMGGMQGPDGDSSDMPGMNGDSSDMPGMMTDQQLGDLKGTQGSGFETMWLQMMIRHHEGAITMAKDEQRQGSYGPALKLAKSIETSQQAEIDHMRELLKR